MILEENRDIKAIFNNKKKSYLKLKPGRKLEKKGFGSKVAL